MIPSKPFYMIRHGETEANAAKWMSGQVDTPLTEEGIKQAGAAAQIASSLDPLPKIVIHSNLSRTRRTAEILNTPLNLPMVEKAEWAEQHFGDWQGQNRDEVLPNILDGMSPPGGETNESFNLRVRDAAIQTLQEYDYPLIVCHGGVFRAFAALYHLKVPRVDNGVLYEFLPKPDQSVFPWKVSRYCNATGRKEDSEQFRQALETLTSSGHPRYQHG